MMMSDVELAKAKLMKIFIGHVMTKEDNDALETILQYVEDLEK